MSKGYRGPSYGNQYVKNQSKGSKSAPSEKEPATIKIKKIICYGIFIAAIVVLILLIPHMEPMKIARDHEAPVIEGVKSEITVYRDISEDTFKEVLLDGVEAVDNVDTGGRAPTINTYCYDELGNRVSEWPFDEGTYSVIYACKDRNGNEAERVETVLYVLDD